MPINLFAHYPSVISNSTRYSATHTSSHIIAQHTISSYCTPQDFYYLIIIMLGGIKKGKRKRKHSSNSSSSGSGNKSTYDTSCASVTATTSAVSGHSSSLTSTTVKSIRTEPATTTPYTVTGTVNSSNISNLSRGPSVALISSTKNEANLNAAHELRLMLAGVKKKAATETNDDSTTVVAEQHGINKNSSAYERFERRRGDGTILNSIDEHKNGNDGDTDAIIVMNSKVAPNFSKEDFRRGARKGKLKSAISSSSSFTNPEDHTIEQMLQEERQSRKGQGQHHQQHGGSNHQSIDEIFARNIARMGSKYKGTEFKMTAGSTAGADEDEINNGIDMNLYTSISNRLTDAERYKRDLSKQIDYTKKQSSVANKCWWWIESQSFAKQRLLALGDFMSLVLVPTHLQLVPYQCYLVPIQHSESFVSCEDEVWEEVQRFKTSLRNMFRQEDKGVLFCETVLSTKSLWQTRMDVIPVPLSVEQDAEL